jgi:hypothetical protein
LVVNGKNKLVKTKATPDLITGVALALKWIIAEVTCGKTKVTARENCEY